MAAPDKWVSAAAVARLLDVSAAESGEPDFAVRLAEQRRLTTLGPLSVVLREEPDLRSALRLLIRYEHVYNEALRMRLDESEGIATIRLWFEFGEPAPGGQALALGIAALHGIMRECVGPHWRRAGDLLPGPSSWGPFDAPQGLRAWTPVRTRLHGSRASMRATSTPETRCRTHSCGPMRNAFWTLSCPREPRVPQTA